jgi:hypothetical protein
MKKKESAVNARYRKTCSNGLWSLLAVLMRDVTRPAETVFLPPFNF